jgi:hypothetical protein
LPSRGRLPDPLPKTTYPPEKKSVNNNSAGKDIDRDILGNRSSGSRKAFGNHSKEPSGHNDVTNTGWWQPVCARNALGTRVLTTFRGWGRRIVAALKDVDVLSSGSTGPRGHGRVATIRLFVVKLEAPISVIDAFPLLVSSQCQSRVLGSYGVACYGALPVFRRLCIDSLFDLSAL